MFIDITDERTIREVQSDFHQQYPFLKIEFFGHSHDFMEPSCPTDKVDPGLKLGSIRKRHVPGRVEIKDDQKTGMLELHLRERYGLNAQVCRLYGKVWVQTSGSDEMTLKEQNEMGRVDSEKLLKPDLLKKMIEL